SIPHAKRNGTSSAIRKLPKRKRIRTRRSGKRGRTKNTALPASLPPTKLSAKRSNLLRRINPMSSTCSMNLDIRDPKSFRPTAFDSQFSRLDKVAEILAGLLLDVPGETLCCDHPN